VKPAFSDGIDTPQELHRATCWYNHSCWLCSAKPVTHEFRVFMPSDVLAEKDPIGFVQARYPLVRHFNHAKMGGTYHKFGTYYSCAHCRKNVEVWAARALHSAALVEISDGTPMIGG
jgi:hypothetical protein